MAKRLSIRERNTAAIAHEADALTPADTVRVQEPVTAPKPRVSAPKAPAKKPAPAPLSDTSRLGIYLTLDQFNDGRGAYLADWSNGGEADTFARWIAAAIDTHAARTPKQRAARGRLRTRSDERTGSARSFNIPTASVQRMRAAITADQQAGRWPSDSAWCAEAIMIATEDAREANGGTLPTPPARLPNRLVR